MGQQQIWADRTNDRRKAAAVGPIWVWEDVRTVGQG